MISAATAKFIEEHGQWTAMAIKLGDGSYTRLPAPDSRLRRLLQLGADTVGKPLNQCRVLDLACLEGHYAIEFALHGSEVVGTEGRAVSVAKCEYAREALGLERARFVQDDVRNLSLEAYGSFDIVICSGLLYHLPAPDVVSLLQTLGKVTARVLLLDTFISLEGRESVEVDGFTLRGHSYFEHDPDSNKSDKLWASLDNNSSFWVTETTLANLLIKAGFTSLADVILPAMPGLQRDRKTYLAIRGEPVAVLSSDPTAEAGIPMARPPGSEIDDSQRARGPVFRLAKRALPPVIKDTIKPALRAVGILPPDKTPDFMRKKR